MYFSYRIPRNEFQTNQETSSLQSSFHSARRWYTDSWEERTAVVLPTRSFLLQYQLTKPGYAHWCNSDATVMRQLTAFWLYLRPITQTDRNVLLNMVIQVKSPQLGRSYVLGHYLLLLFCQMLILLPTFVREASLCNTQRSRETCWRQESGCLVPCTSTSTILPPLPRLRQHLKRGGRKNGRWEGV